MNLFASTLQVIQKELCFIMTWKVECIPLAHTSLLR